jgi:hypothetical protein
MSGMDTELLVVPDCPNEGPAAALLRAALDDIGLGSVDYTVTVIDTQDAAERRHFSGSRRSRSTAKICSLNRIERPLCPVASIPDRAAYRRCVIYGRHSIGRLPKLQLND